MRETRHTTGIARAGVAAIVLVTAGCPSGDRPVEHAKPGPVADPGPVGSSAEGEGTPRVGERDQPWTGAGPSHVPPPPVPGPSYTPPMPVISGSSSTPVSSAGLSIKYKVPIGHTTYRSTIHWFDSKIVVDSNGDQYKSGNDGKDGVWVLDPADGSTILKVDPPGSGEKDANGVALTSQALIFGTDQDRVYKVDWNGNVIWKTSTKGDVEAAPALADLDGDTVLDVLAGAEGGVFYALDGKTGKVMHTTKAGQGYYGATGFVGAPALFDASGDGVADVFFPCRDETFRAVDGKTGKSLWSHQTTSGMHGAPIVVDATGDGVMEVVFTEAYSEVYCADASTGAIHWNVELSNPDGGIEGLFGPLGWYPAASCVLVGTAWWGNSEGVYCIEGKTGSVLWRYNETKKNITSGFVVGDVDGSPGAEAVFGTESGAIVALSPAGTPVRRLELGGPVECTPTLADVDGDSKIEILAAANDGFLYVLETDGAAPAVIGFHRGHPENDGVM